MKRSVRLKIPVFLFILLLILVIILSVLNKKLVYKNEGKVFDSGKKLAEIRSKKADVFGYLRENLKNLVEKYGIQAVTALTKEAFRQQAITMYQCHTLAHYTGHFYPNESKNLDDIVNYDIDYCEGGFKHGLEGEITARNESDTLEKLHRLCSLFRRMGSIGACYHGSGHEFMREKLDIEKALSSCDSLFERGPKEDVSDCYKGVFSELTNLIGGVDGETGYGLKGSPPLTINASPMDFCSQLKDVHQIPCALELNGYQLSPSSTHEQIEKRLKGCVDNKYHIKLQAACVQSIAAVSAQHVLPRQSTITPPSFILTLPSELRRAYITGTLVEMGAFIKNGVEKDWQTFCRSLQSVNESNCQQIINY